MAESERSLTTITPEHFATGGFFFAAALMENLVKKGVLTQTEAQAVVRDALNKVRASDRPEISGAADLFIHFYGAGQGYQTP